jgi:lantibiotic modifying enzyme
MTQLESTGDELRREVERIYADIQDARFELPDGTTGWISYDRLLDDDSSSGRLLLRGKKGLYSGQLGIALYFAAMYGVFEEESYRRDVRDSIEFLLEEDIDELTDGLDPGVLGGIGSFVYGLSVIGELTGERQYKRRAREFARSLTDEAIAADDEYDVLLGVGGTIAGFLHLYEQTGEEVALDKAVRCGEHLLANRYEEGEYRVWDTYWDDSRRSFTTGMSHGAAGIGSSLYRLYGHTDRDEFRDAADEAIAYENDFYSEDETNWKSNWASDAQYPLWWAYGAPGIGLARLGSLESHDSDTLRRDVERAMAVEPQLTPRDSICRGTFAQVDLLVELGRSYDEAYREQAVELAASAVERKRREGGYRIVCGDTAGITNPTLFLGMAGIGYTILRLSRPEEIPSVLRFE